MEQSWRTATTIPVPRRPETFSSFKESFSTRAKLWNSRNKGDLSHDDLESKNPRNKHERGRALGFPHRRRHTGGLRAIQKESDRPRFGCTRRRIALARCYRPL